HRSLCNAISQVNIIQLENRANLQRGASLSHSFIDFCLLFSTDLGFAASFMTSFLSSFLFSSFFSPCLSTSTFSALLLAITFSSGSFLVAPVSSAVSI
ncbi:hypothetical protein PFISCL1PPCAC_21846, partial [Pristionchus fissidentatus]